MSQTSNIGSQLGFPLGFNAFTGSSLTESVSDTLSLSDNILLTNPVISESVSDTISLSDSAIITVGSATVARVTQIAAEVVTEDTATAAVHVTQITVEVVTEDSGLNVTFLVSDVFSLYDNISTASFATGPAAPGVTQALIEVAAHQEQGHSPPLLIITQNIIEWTNHHEQINTPPNLIITQALIEWVIHPPNNLIATQVCIEVAYKPQNGPVKAHYKRFLPQER